MVPTNLTRYLTLPKEGLSDDVIRTELDTLANMDHTRWEDGYVSGAVYHGEEDLIKLQTEAYGKFTVANPIHPDVFPGVRKMEAEVVAMVLAMFNAPPGAAGVSTSGGFSVPTSLAVSLGWGTLNWLGAIPAIFTIDKFGRRRLLLITFPMMFACLLWTSFSFYFPSREVKI
ncbi:hypothetical protein BN1708_017113, partial [Verticillium longisporum]